MPYFGVLEGFLKGIYKGSIKGLGFRVVRVSENWGVPYFGVYYNKDPTIYRTILGPPVFGNSHKDFEQRAEGVVLRRFRVRVLGWFRAGQGGFPTLVYFFLWFCCSRIAARSPWTSMSTYSDFRVPGLRSTIL